MEFPLICVLSMLSTVLAFPPFAGYYFQGDSESRLQQCSSASKPCKILVKQVSNQVSDHRIFTSPNICNCAGGTCPLEWDEMPENTITRYLRSKDRFLSLQMKFCSPVAPQRMCRGNETALVVKGHSLVPSEIVEFNCRCFGNHPLIISKAWYQGYNERYQEYVCELPRCPTVDSQCMSVSNQPPRVRETVFECDCGRSRSCKADHGRRTALEESKGYCSLY
ncbi:hypothetical protein LOTGIDRAFT_232897 [Lottia gigantea]|uniref:Uncharacterized protein n=1 Tax=Lottia gigantea TaxID=225164 RepID=V4AH88_LOTGI|nr:hypothetical protein LOTGIDRAFT_232897 [Lottia gigantea]ESO92756.1 hypothetical protein LOTGIDRAFT_232897 [Lottia gigantea]